MKNVIDLVKAARAKVAGKQLAFEHEHMEEIKEQMLKRITDDPDLIYEGTGENTNEQMVKAGLALINEQYDEVGRLLAPTIHAYLWKLAVSDVEENYILQEDFEQHPSLTTAERNPDLVS